MSKKLIYGIVGSGHVASHMAEYFKLEGIEYITWDRQSSSINAYDKLSKADIILILISDKNIKNFVKENKNLKHKTLIHFSGSFYSKQVLGVHPLMTFGKKLYNLKTYRSIPFIFDAGLDFAQLFPALKNLSYPIKPENKGLYHALCVLSGNFTIMLWLKAKNDFEKKLNLPWEILLPYLKQIFNNINTDIDNALTGPVKRNDEETILNDIKSLDEVEWKDVYRTFEKTFRREEVK